ncbi:hypothetical protein [Calothrix rhizosoleniae]|nr:hypothetical protein [Calothrix rhizosoleniae]
MKNKIGANEEKSRTIPSIHDTFPKLSSGEIRVKEAEKLVKVIKVIKKQ